MESRRQNGRTLPIRTGTTCGLLACLSLWAADPIVVTNLADAGPGSLRSAIEQANAVGGGTIHLAGLSGRLLLLAELPTLAGRIQILGVGNREIHLTGTNLLHALSIAPNATCFISGLTFSNFQTAPYGSGAAISNAGVLHLRSCSFVSNFTSGFGGAVYNAGSLEAQGCDFVGNRVVGENGSSTTQTAAGGGGAGLGGALFSSGQLWLTDCRVQGNTARGGGRNGPAAVAKGGGPFGGLGGTTNGVMDGAPGGLGSGGGGGAGVSNGPYPCGQGGAGGFGAGGGSGITSYPSGCGSSSGAAGKFGGSTGGGAGLGGGIFANSGQLFLQRCVIEDNSSLGGVGSASGAGGGVFVRDGDCSVKECLFRRNLVQGSDGAAYEVGHFGTDGGDSLGGGLYLNAGSASVTGTTFAENRAIGSDGGRGSRGSGGPGLPAGGGLCSDAAQTIVYNCTFSGNLATAGNSGINGLFSPYIRFGGSASGAGVFARSGGHLTVFHTTFTANAATGGAGVPLPPQVTNAHGRGYGGGLAAEGKSTITMAGCIVQGNSASYEDSSPDLYGTFESLSRNLIGVTNGSTGWMATDLLGAFANLGPLQDNGGFAPTHALSAGSPAVDAGLSLRVLFDQRGERRTVDMANIPDAPGSDGTDLGAVEVDPVLRLVGVQRNATDCVVTFTSVSDLHYTIEYATNLDSPHWSVLIDDSPGSGGIVSRQDPAASAAPAKFYRVRVK